VLKIGHKAIARVAEAVITDHTALVIQSILGSTKISEIAVYFYCKNRVGLIKFA
jgi:hypothetical protein